MSIIFGISANNDREKCQIMLQSMREGLMVFNSGPSQMLAHDGFAAGFLPILLTQEDQFEKQPISSFDGAYTAVIDARLDDRENTIQRLGLDAARRSKIPDSRIVLEAFLKWGTECVEYLIGDFTFVIRDNASGELFCARDHCGQSPFYYVNQPNGVFAFASFPHGLFPLPQVGREIDYREISHFLQLCDNCSEMSQYVGIYDLPAGSQLIVNSNKVRAKQYWNLELNITDQSPNKPYAEELLDLTSKAVNDRLRIAGQVGSYLSGGLDSSAVATLAAKALASSGVNLPTFTYVPSGDYKPERYPNRFTDESPYVSELAKIYPNIDPTFVSIDDRSLFHRLDELIELAGLNSHGYYNRLWIEKILEVAHERKVTAILDARSGNITLSHGGQSYMTELIRKRKLIKFFKSVEAHASYLSASKLRILVSYGLLPFLPESVRKLISRSERNSLNYNPFIQREVYSLYDCNTDSANSLETDRMKRTNFLRFGFKRSAIGRGARQSMYGVKILEPTLDKRLVEFSLNLPMEAFMSKGRHRGLIREATQGMLPNSIRLNSRKGVQLADWHILLRNDLTNIKHRVSALADCKEASGILDISALRDFSSLVESSENEIFKRRASIQLHLAQALALGTMIQNLTNTKKYTDAIL